VAPLITEVEVVEAEIIVPIMEIIKEIAAVEVVVNMMIEREAVEVYNPKEVHQINQNFKKLVGIALIASSHLTSYRESNGATESSCDS
jgi:hypothetical protein